MNGERVSWSEVQSQQQPRQTEKIINIREANDVEKTHHEACGYHTCLSNCFQYGFPSHCNLLEVGPSKNVGYILASTIFVSCTHACITPSAATNRP